MLRTRKVADRYVEVGAASRCASRRPVRYHSEWVIEVSPTRQDELILLDNAPLHIFSRFPAVCPLLHIITHIAPARTDSHVCHIYVHICVHTFTHIYTYLHIVADGYI